MSLYFPTSSGKDIARSIAPVSVPHEGTSAPMPTLPHCLYEFAHFRPYQVTSLEKWRTTETHKPTQTQKPPSLP
eukprot:3717-Amphidinium_carterae.1